MESTELCCDEFKNLPDEIKEQLCLLDNTQRLMARIFIGLLLQYGAVGVQRTQLLDSVLPEGCCRTDGCPDPKTMQLGSSLVILSSLLGFQNQINDINTQTLAAGDCPDTTDATLGLIVIMIAVIRYLRLLEPDQSEVSRTDELVESDAEL